MTAPRLRTPALEMEWNESCTVSRPKVEWHSLEWAFFPWDCSGV